MDVRETEQKLYHHPLEVNKIFIYLESAFSSDQVWLKTRLFNIIRENEYLNRSKWLEYSLTEKRLNTSRFIRLVIIRLFDERGPNLKSEESFAIYSNLGNEAKDGRYPCTDSVLLYFINVL